jgi:hypothetical protein
MGGSFKAINDSTYGIQYIFKLIIVRLVNFKGGGIL